MEYLKNKKKVSEKNLFPKKISKKTHSNLENSQSPETYYKQETGYIPVEKARVKRTGRTGDVPNNLGPI